TILYEFEDNARDQNYARLMKNFEILEDAVSEGGEPFTLVPMPMPSAVTTEDGKRLPASYLNFYIGNTKVIIPLFGVPQDDEALSIIKAAFPGREAVGIPATPIVYGLGTFHCMSQQQPVP
ncbi:MAG: agmatine deiminase family protein, partial [Patescibacteria group bacterium]